ncbi:hypothetical protein B0A48_11228 [Cryoendolithus antarcticus]|uniref:F-box domain-containing protein n=1 Tax=Cryoendolithus antarcticus TaxID=1507870 RepID=A0A1V8SUT2_9PEZI|nr:hypothetical protein B0A48_11228 [Cryoendolithus antarcticus]
MARILTLPGELRNRIYSFATYEDTPINICCKSHQPALSFINKQFREECLPVFYSFNPIMAKRWGVSSARLERVLKYAKHTQAVEAVSGDELIIAMRTSEEDEAHRWVYQHYGDHTMFMTRNVAIRTIDNLLRLLGILGTEKDDQCWTVPLPAGVMCSRGQP